MTKATLVEALVAARDELYAALHAVPEPDLAQPNAVAGMSIQELCGHISAWENRLLTAMQQISQGDARRIGETGFLAQETDFCNDPEFNRAQQRKRRGWPWRDILSELVWMREETGWTVANMPESDFFAGQPVETVNQGWIQISPADIVRRLTVHDRQHAADIRAWLAKQRATNS
jgi:hypothetical protein